MPYLVWSFGRIPLKNIDNIILTGLVRVDTLQDFGTILLVPSFSSTDNNDNDKVLSKSPKKSDTNKQKRSTQSYQRQMFDMLQDLFNSKDELDIRAGDYLLPVLVCQFLNSAALLHPASDSRSSQTSAATPISLTILRELGFQLFKKLTSYLQNRPRSPVLLRAFNSLISAYYTNTYFGMVSSISFLNDDVLRAQEILLRDWLKNVLSPELELLAILPNLQSQEKSNLGPLWALS